MLTHLTTAVAQIIIAVISHLGYAGVAGLMALESACVPLPSEIILPFSGYLAANGRFQVFWIGIWGAVGCNLGSMIAYGVGFYGGRPLVERYGHWLFMSHHDLERVEHWFAHHGDGTVFFSRLLPVVRTYIALPAGVARMPLLRFNVYTFAGSLPWCWLLAYIGLRLGEHWEKIGPYFHRFDRVWVAVLVIAFALWFWHHAKMWKSDSANAGVNR